MALATKYDLTRGDAFNSGVFNLIHPAGLSAWDNVVVRAQLRQTPDGPLVYDFQPELTVAADGDNYGVLSFTLTIPPSITSGMSCPTYCGDVEITANLFPRLTPIQIEITMTKDFSR